MTDYSALEEAIELMQAREAAVPQPTERLLLIRCPQCGRRIWRAHRMEYMMYVTHYLAEHDAQLSR